MRSRLGPLCLVIACLAWASPGQARDPAQIGGIGGTGVVAQGGGIGGTGIDLEVTDHAGSHGTDRSGSHGGASTSWAPSSMGRPGPAGISNRTATDVSPAGRGKNGRGGRGGGRR